MVSIFFSYANFVVMGYFKDISADRASGYSTFVVAFGWKRAAVGSDIFAFLSVLATGWAISKVFTYKTLFSWKGVSLIFFFSAIIILMIAQIGIHRIRDEKKAHLPIAHVVRGFLLLHLAEIILLKPDWTIPVIIFYSGFEIVLKKRPEKRQV